MTSFFRKRIAQKVLALLQQRHEFEIPASYNLISSVVKVNRSKGVEPKLTLNWKKIEQVCNQNVSVSPSDVLRLLRIQGLPTAEGFIDIELSDLDLVFTIDKHIYSKLVLLDIYNNEDNLVRNSCLFEGIPKKNIVVHCSVPSLGAPFNFTHFRSAIHATYIANINRFVGHNVVKVAHVNDWGPEMATFLTGYKQFNRRQVCQKKDTFYFNEVKKAAEVEYKKNCEFTDNVNNCFEKMQSGDSEVMSDWQNLQQLCIDHYDLMYKRFGVTFDEIHFDSSCHHKFKSITSELVDSDIISYKNDKVKINSSGYLDGNDYADNIAIIENAVYDLCRYINVAAEMKQKYNFDAMYYVAPTSENCFLKTVFYLIERLKYAQSEELHQMSLQLLKSFGSKNRQNKSTDSLLDQVKENMILKLHENLQMEQNKSLEEMAEHLSLSSLIVNDFKHRKKVDYVFQWTDIISLNGDTGAAFQLCHAGLKGILNSSEVIITDNTDTSALLEAQAHYLIQHLSRFDEMVYKSYMNLEPSIIYQYLYSLWYFTDQVTNVIKLDMKHDRLRAIKARLLLLSATHKILNKCLHILGVTPLENAYTPEKDFVTSQQ